MNRKIIVIVGPTASGKTDLAKNLIKKFTGEVISADSRQIFKYMDIGTGKDKSFFQHMVDIRHPWENYSVAEYQQEVYKILNDIWSGGKIPFIVGGTALYIDAVLQGFQFPKTDSKIRNKISQFTTVELIKKLKKFDPLSVEKNRDNRRRLVRALEVYLLTSRPQSEYRKKKPSFQYLILGIDRQRQELYGRIDERVDQRIEQGMVEEIENLLKMGVSYQRLQQFGLEYRHISRYLLKKEELNKSALSVSPLAISTSEAEAELKKNLQSEIINLKFKIHAFARRQLTWWRKNKQIHWIKSQKEAEKIINQFLNE